MTENQGTTELDVLVVGAGLSGIGAAYRLSTECPGRTFAILEARDTIGGTWDLFRYPGIRSDSDMYTLGYPFHPWTAGKAIADGPSILSYIKETARKFDLERHVRFRHRIVGASWSSADARWTVDVEIGDAKTPARFRCRFLYLCSGYYAYDAAHAPVFAGKERFRGRVVHPQWWPEDLDYTDKKVVVIGSGATAVTLVPAMADRAAHVTMLQRSPSYVASLPSDDVIAETLRKFLPARTAHRIARGKNVLLGLGFYQFCRRFPEAASRFLRERVARRLPRDYPVDTHFAPSYAPWDQRLCVVPDSDLFRAIKKGKASVVTDRIETFTETGLRLASGEELEADVVVTATGLKVLPCGGIRLAIDGRAIELRDAVVYKGLMFSGVPNLAWCVGYTNASWTLRADLSSRFVCRALNLMERRGLDVMVPELPAGGGGEARPLLGLSSGYVARAADVLPKQGSKAPWFLRQNYVLDRLTMTFGRVDDGTLRFAKASAHAAAAARAPAAAPHANGASSARAAPV